MIHSDTIGMRVILICQSKLDRKELLAEVSNNAYATSNCTAIYWTLRREPSILLKSIHIGFPEK